MNGTLQMSITFLIVAFASCYAIVRFMPRTWRLRLASAAADGASRLGLSDVASRRVEAKLSSGGACGSCDSCKACATPATTKDADAASAAPTSSRHPHIPIRRA